jgi:pimeloyl-ACP methyl ester carboxylesterase
MKTWLAGLSLCLAAPVACAAPDAVESPVSLSSSGGSIKGSLLLPRSTGRLPVVLLISGSGPTDRDGNTPAIAGRNDSLKLLAHALADAGFASLRYDKRGIAASAGAMTREVDMRLETYVEDAADWARQLAADPRFSGVAIVGHSEGSLIGMLAARQAGAAAFVSIAGPGAAASKLLRVQLLGKLPPDLVERNEQILRALEAGRLVDDVPPALAALYRPSVQPYLVSWFRYTPAVEIGKLHAAVAIFQGDTDIQVPVSEAELLARGKPDAELQVINGMNHVLKMVPADPARQIASYGDPSLPVSPGLVESLVKFLRRSMPEATPH